LEITQRLKPRVSIEDFVILMYRNNFSAYGIIKDTSLEKEHYLGEAQQFLFEVGNIIPIEAPNDLDGFAYSLPKVYKYYDKPYYHFNRSFGRLTKYEYDTIINHDYFISRTAFGRIINSLHPIHRFSIVNFISQRYPELVFSGRKDYAKLFEIMAGYIESSIILQAEILKKSQSIIQDLRISDEIGFGDPDSNKALLIKNQIKHIEYAELRLKGFNLNYILSGIREIYKDEESKNGEFQDSTLPVNFKK